MMPRILFAALMLAGLAIAAAQIAGEADSSVGVALTDGEMDFSVGACPAPLIKADMQCSASNAIAGSCKGNGAGTCCNVANITGYGACVLQGAWLGGGYIRRNLYLEVTQCTQAPVTICKCSGTTCVSAPGNPATCGQKWLAGPSC